MARSASLSLRRKLAFAAVFVLLLTSVLVIGAEAVLRVVGWGHSAAFAEAAVDAQGRAIWRENRWCTRPFFPEALVRRPVPFSLPQKKAPGTYRLFILGSSAAMGDPEPSFGVARVTEVLLAKAYPELRFEVVNAAVTAINAHVVRDLAEDCADLEADGLFVYEGNNEVLGPYGPGTAFTPFLDSALWLDASRLWRRLRLAQWLGSLSRPTGGAADWGGLQMFQGHRIAANDPRLLSVRRNFGRNLTHIAHTGATHGATVWLGTVLVNERDFAPFASLEPTLADSPDSAGWREAWLKGKSLATAKAWADAAPVLEQAVRQAPGHAESAFLLGRAKWETGRIHEADTAFAAALEHDALRFRTDRALNETVREVARATGARLIDCETAARTSPGGLGEAFLYEHVHLNMQGTYLVARLLADAVVQDLVRRGRWTGEAGTRPWPELAEVRRALAYSPYEQVLILQELLHRHGQAPFVGRWGNDARLRELAQREEQIRSLVLRPESAEPILDLYREALRGRPEDAVLWRNFGSAAHTLGRSAVAAEALERAHTLSPRDTDTLAALIATYDGLGGTEKATAYRQELQALEPRHPGLAKRAVR